MRLVFFDFDGTLTTKDTIWPYLSFVCGRLGRSTGTRLSLSIDLLMLKFRVLSNHTFKERLLKLLVRAEFEQNIAELTRQFHLSQLQPILNQSMVRLLVAHAAAGDQVYLVSSNFDFFLSPLQERWPLKGILATQAEVLNGRFTGRIVGRACDGEEKLARVVARFGESSAREAVAYADGAGDSVLLEFVKKGHWVDARRGMSGASRSLGPA